MLRLGVVTGLASESGCLRPLLADGRISVLCAGASSAGAEAAARALAQSGCRGLLSFGTAGALDRRHSPGTVVVAERIVAPDGRIFPADAAWHLALMSAIGMSARVVGAAAAGSDAPVVEPEDKRALGERTGAVVVDMESHRVASVAAERDLPFLCVRAVADSCARQVPGWVPATVTAEGKANPARVARNLLRRPWDVVPLAGLGLDYRRALAALRRIALRAGPLFQLPG